MIMNKEELKKLIKENLTIELYEAYQGGAKYLNVEVRFDGELISKSETDYGSYDDRMY